MEFNTVLKTNTTLVMLVTYVENMPERCFFNSLVIVEFGNPTDFTHKAQLIYFTI